MAAIAAAQAGRRVVLAEQMPRLGMKLMASGGGRGNLTHLLDANAFAAAFGRQGRFILPAVESMPPAALRDFFVALGVPTVVEDHSKVFPASGRAADVQAAIARRMEQLGVTVQLECTVSRLWIDQGRLTGIVLADGPRIAAGRVVLACGGRSWPSLGGAGGGYALAGQAGHAIVEPTPALVGLLTREKWPARLAGVALRGARVWIDRPRQAKAGVGGDVLFTHRGLSGPAVLDISGTVAGLLGGGSPVPLRIELAAGRDGSAWKRQIDSWRTAAGRREVINLLREDLPASLCRLLCELAGVGEQTPAAQFPAAGRDALAGLLAGLPLTVTGTEGFETAFVTRGGVKLKDVDPTTLGSRILPGLFFAGELLDLDGPTGGFNLQWAFASGRLAGAAASSCRQAGMM